MDKQRLFWEEAGRVGYGKVIFSNALVEKHISSAIWNTAIHTARNIGLNAESRILELACGDGSFANSVLAANFCSVEGIDYSVSAVEKANASRTSGSVSFRACDITKLNYTSDQCWDGAFVIGFLHHVKSHARDIVRQLAKVAPRVVVADPNGDNILRKALEFLPNYRKAGEQSFRLKQLKGIFSSAGYELVSQDLVCIMPSFTPALLLPAAIKLEKAAASFRVFKNLNSVYILGFRQAQA